MEHVLPVLPPIRIRLFIASAFGKRRAKRLNRRVFLPASFHLRGIVRESAPDFLIVIDALAAASAARLGNTVQLCDTGISPGSGVHNARPKIDRDALGVPVIAVGLPTVIDGAALDGAPNAPLIVTPREIDLLLRRAAHTLGVAINLALQPTLTLPEITQLMA